MSGSPDIRFPPHYCPSALIFLRHRRDIFAKAGQNSYSILPKSPFLFLHFFIANDKITLLITKQSLANLLFDISKIKFQRFGHDFASFDIVIIDVIVTKLLLKARESIGPNAAKIRFFQPLNLFRTAIVFRITVHCNKTAPTASYSCFYCVVVGFYAFPIRCFGTNVFVFPMLAERAGELLLIRVTWSSVILVRRMKQPTSQMKIVEI